MSRRKRKRQKPTEIKTQTSKDKYLESTVQVTEGSGRFNQKPPPFSFATAMSEYRSWPGAAINLNAKAVASAPIKLFARDAGPEKEYRWKTRRMDDRDADTAYLYGELDHKPSKAVIRAAKSYREGFVEVQESDGRRLGIMQLLHDANRYFNGFDLMQLLTIHLEATGNAYLHPIIDEVTGVPSEIWPMPPHWVQIIPDREKFIGGYVYGKSWDTEQRFETNEVIHFRQTPSSVEGLFYGQGKMELGWDIVCLNRQLHQMDLAFIENGARPDYMILSKRGQKDQLDRLERKINRGHRGVQKTGRFMTLSGEVELVPMTFSPKDMTGRKEIIDEIATVFGVPQTLLMANDPNLSNARQGFANWKAGTILPLLTLIEQRLNEDLVPLFPELDGNAFLAFDNPVPDDRDFELNEMIQKVSSGIWTRAEARELDGREQIEGSDELLVTGGLMPIDAVGQPAAGGAFPGFALNKPATATQAVSEPTQTRQEADPAAQIIEAAEQAVAKIKQAAGDGIEKLTKSITPPPPATPEIKPATTLVVPDREVKIYDQVDELWPGDYHPPFTLSVNKQAEVGDSQEDAREDQPVGLEEQLRIELGKVLQEAGKTAVETMMDDGTKMANKIGNLRIKMDDPAIVRVMRSLTGLDAKIMEAISSPLTLMLTRSGGKALLDVTGGAGGDGGSAGLAPLGFDADDFGPELAAGFDVSNPEVAKFVGQTLDKLAAQITATTLEAVKRVIQQGLDAGQPTTLIAEAIQEAGTFSSARAMAIARTEAANAYIQGSKEGWRQSGVVSGMRWKLAPQPCQFCKAIQQKFAGRVIPLDGTFMGVGDQLTGTDGGKLNITMRDIDGPPLHPNCRCTLISVRSRV